MFDDLYVQTLQIRRRQNKNGVVENLIFTIPKANSISDFETKVNFINSAVIIFTVNRRSLKGYNLQPQF